MYKSQSIVVSAAVLITCLVAQAQLGPSPAGKDLKAALFDLSSKVAQSASSEGMRQSFDKHASDLLSSWETAAPSEMSQEVVILKKGESVSSSEAADRISKMGVQARGACLALAKTLGDGGLIMPGDIPRLFGAKPFTAGRRAAVALSAMNEAGVVTLIWAVSHDFSDTDARNTEYRRDLGYETLKAITGKDLPANADSWIQWFTSNPESWILVHAATAQDKTTEKDVGHVSIPPWVKNEFFWCLVVGAIIVFFINRARKKK